MPRGSGAGAVARWTRGGSAALPRDAPGRPAGSVYGASVTPVLDGSRRLVALLALTLGVFLVTVNVGVVVVALPSIQADLDAPADQAAWVIDAFNLVGASLLLSAGYAADRFGRKRVLCAGYAVFS